MIIFRFNPLNAAIGDADTLAQLELGAYISGEMSVNDLDVDIDLALDEYIQRAVPEEDRERYLSEPEYGEGEMMEALASDLMNLAEARQQLLNDAYPFEIVRPNTLRLRATPNPTISVAYIVVQAMRLAQRDLVELVAPNAAAQRVISVKMWRSFERVFEYVAAYTLAGSTMGMPIVLSNCRSSRVLHKKLSGVCRRVKSGRVRTYADWSPVQLNSNDGGIDVIVHVNGPDMPGDAYLIIAGATYQKKKIDQKIINFDARFRFKNYFSIYPAAFFGALIRLADEDYLTIEKCRTADCLFFGYSQIIRFMGVRPAANNTVKALGAIDNRVKQALAPLGAVVWQGNTNSYIRYRI